MDLNQNDSSDPGVVAKILMKYGLNESNSGLAQKFFGENPESTNGEIVIWIASDFANKKMSEDEMIKSLKEFLKVSDEIAKKISDDIKINLLPLLKNTDVAEKQTDKIENNIENNNTVPQKIKKPIETEKKVIKEEKRKAIFEKPKNSGKKETPKFNKTDSYREPIA